MISSDLNVRLDRPDDRDSQRLADLFEVFGFSQSIQWSHPVGLLRSVVAVTTVVRRRWHHLDVNALSAAFRKSQLSLPDCWSTCSVDDLTSTNNTELTSICVALVPSLAV